MTNIDLFNILLTIVSIGDGDDRQSSLLLQIGLENCIIPIGKEVEHIVPNYNKCIANAKLTELRDKSINLDKREYSFSLIK